MSIHDILNNAGLFNPPVLHAPVEVPAVIVDLNVEGIKNLVGDGDEREINVKAVYVYSETFEMERRVSVTGPQESWEKQITDQLNDLTDIPIYAWTGPIDKDTTLERWSYNGGA